MRSSLSVGFGIGISSTLIRFSFVWYLAAFCELGSLVYDIMEEIWSCQVRDREKTG